MIKLDALLILTHYMDLPLSARALSLFVELRPKVHEKQVQVSKAFHSRHLPAVSLKNKRKHVKCNTYIVAMCYCR